MKKIVLSLIACGALMSATAMDTLTSPDGQIILTFDLTPAGQPQYSVTYKDKQVILPSTLGFEIKDETPLTTGFKQGKPLFSSADETWAPVWGESDSIVNRYNQMIVPLTRKAGNDKRKMNIVFRAYDDGIALRYEFPKQQWKGFTITDELTRMALAGDHTAWWIPGDYDTQEYKYTRSRLSEIRAKSEDARMHNLSQTGFSPTGVQTSLMLKTDDGLYINLHEAALVDYPAMHLNLDDSTMTFTSWLTPDRDGNKAVVTTPFKTPWRTVMVSDKATDILASDLILNLNDPCVLDDTSWIHPTKYMGVWWEMISGKSSWSYCDAENFDLATFDYSKATPNGRHGANNENVRRYIDFAADAGMNQLLIEGWNIGWEDWSGKEKDYVFDFLTPYPDFDLDVLNAYAKSKGIKLMMHH